MSRRKPWHYQVLGDRGDRKVVLAVLAVYEGQGWDRTAAISFTRQSLGGPAASTIWRWLCDEGMTIDRRSDAAYRRAQNRKRIRAERKTRAKAA